MFAIICGLWCAVMLIVIVIFLLIREYLMQRPCTKASEKYRACPDIDDCPASTKSGCVLNPFVWPFSGSSNFDNNLSKKRLDLENFTNPCNVRKDEDPAPDTPLRGYVDWNGVAPGQLEDSGDHGLRSMSQEYDHDTLSC